MLLSQVSKVPRTCSDYSSLSYEPPQQSQGLLSPPDPKCGHNNGEQQLNSDENNIFRFW